MLKNMVGVEAEFFMLNKKGEAIVPPMSWDRDDFPLLGEIRGAPGEKQSEVYANYIKREMEIKTLIDFDKADMLMDSFMRIKLSTYREAMKAMREWSGTKDSSLDKIRNIYGTDINDFSDQIIGKNHKIQGINASCGLHIHFSSEEKVNEDVNEFEYDLINLPLTIAENQVVGGVPININLYKKGTWKTKKTITARASQLNQPTTEWIVKQMDDEFFEKFAPPEAERTKYRKPGYYEVKPYGFEYRSLPANKASIDALPMIIAFAFKLLNDTQF